MIKKIIKLTTYFTIFCLLIISAGCVNSASIENPISSNDISSVLYDIVEEVGGVVASLSSVAFVIAGILYIGSTANPDLRATAKKAIIWAVIGTTLGLSASAIVNFVKSTVG